MPLAADKTLEEIRTEVLTLAGFGGMSNQNSDSLAIANSCIREAVDVLFLRYNWLARKKTVSIELLVDQKKYDVPSGTTLGKILKVVFNGEGEKTKLEATSLAEASDDETGSPTHYEFIDGDISLYPIPDAECENKTLTVRYIETPLSMVNEKDKCNIDARAVIMHALVLMYEKKGEMTNAGRAEVKADAYLRSLQAQQSEGPKTIQIGGHLSQTMTDSFAPRRTRRNKKRLYDGRFI